MMIDLPIWANDIDNTGLGMPVKATIEVLTAIFCGLIVGQERERKEKPAGLRTMTLICLGSTIFTIISVALATSKYNDPARVAAQIVTGIGFLGAGVIMRDRGAVTGLTTAATIWVTAALGVMVGCGYCVPAMATAVLTFILLHSLNYLDRDWLHPHSKKQNWTMTFDDNNGLTNIKIRYVFSRHNVIILSEESVTIADNVAVTLVFQICNHSHFHTQMLDELTNIRGVTSIRKN